jgi:ribonucleases P/MRP protein subunit RPP40
VYERAGLAGKAIQDGGRKHIKTRYGEKARLLLVIEGRCSWSCVVVEIDLRQSSMVHGKRGFERIVWAAKNILNQPATWLFYDFRSRQTDNGSGTRDFADSIGKV